MSLLDDPNYWRVRAEDMRRLAAAEPDPSTRALLEVVAQSYDDLAARAEKRREYQMIQVTEFGSSLSASKRPIAERDR
jgi:hypothetical protein